MFYYQLKNRLVIIGVFAIILLMIFNSCHTHHACMAVSNNGKPSYYNNQREREARRTKKEFRKNNPTGIKPSEGLDADDGFHKSKEKNNKNKGDKTRRRKNRPVL